MASPVPKKSKSSGAGSRSTLPYFWNDNNSSTCSLFLVSSAFSPSLPLPPATSSPQPPFPTQGIPEFGSQYARLTKLGTQFARLSEFDTLTTNYSISGVSSHFLSFHPFSLFIFFSTHEMTKLPLLIHLEFTGRKPR